MTTSSHASAAITLTELFAPNKITTIVLRGNETVELLPEVKLQILQPVAGRISALFGLTVPRDVPVNRKENFDCLIGNRRVVRRHGDDFHT